MVGTWGIMPAWHAWTTNYGCFDKEEEFEWFIK
jgi:hypothetical protein